MKKILLIILITIHSLPCIAQVKYEPHILILSPEIFGCDTSLQYEADTSNKNLIKTALLAIKGQASQNDKNSNQPENVKLMQQSSIDFLKDINVFNEISVLIQQDLAYHFFESFPNCLILVKNEKSKNSIAGLQAIADSEQAPYILNFPSIYFYKRNNQTWCRVTVQLYDRASNSLFIDKEYSGDWNNPGFEFTCQQGTIGCTINNSMAALIPDIIQQVATHNSTLIKKRQLASERADFIGSSVYSQALDGELVKKVIAPDDSTIKTGNMYQCFYNADKTKFVAFFLQYIEKKDAKALLENRSDQDVKIITSKKINEEGYLDQKPQIYAYIVKGLLYNHKWYYEKTQATYFDANNITEAKIEYLNNLQGWDFFEEGTTKPNEGFWEGNLFTKVKDRRKGADWERVKDIYAIEERNDRDYIGLYEIVANQLKKEKETANNLFQIKIVNEYCCHFIKTRLG